MMYTRGLNVKEKLIARQAITPERFEEPFQQFTLEMRDNPDCYGISYFLTAWGEIPS